MASRVYLSWTYLLPRFALWVLLLVVAIIDGLRHRHVRSRAWQLYAALTGVVGLGALREAVLLAYASTTSSAVFDVWIFMSDLADAAFIAVMLLIAAGFW